MKATALRHLHRRHRQQRRVGLCDQHVARLRPGKNGTPRRGIKAQIVETAADQGGPAEPGRGDPVYRHPADRLGLGQKRVRSVIALAARDDPHICPATCQMES